MSSARPTPASNWYVGGVNHTAKHEMRSLIASYIIAHDPIIVLHDVDQEGSPIMLLSAIVYGGGIVLHGIVRINRNSPTFTREPLVHYTES